MECAIQKTLGVTEECSGASCPLWEVTDGTVPEGCFVERRLASDLNNCELAGWFVALRHTLEHTRVEQGRLP
jgi:hypothetical protein